MVYGYARVSTKGQAKNGNGMDAQIQALKAAGAEVIYSDAFTGTRTDRPEFSKLCDTITSGDTLIVTKLDRMARSVIDGADIINKLLKKNVDVNILNMGKLDNSPSGRLITTIFLAFAEFERDIIVERTQEGKAIARTKQGYKDGRPKKYTQAQMLHAMSLLDGHSYNQVSAMTGISRSTLIRYKQDHKSEIEDYMNIGKQYTIIDVDMNTACE